MLRVSMTLRAGAGLLLLLGCILTQHSKQTLRGGVSAKPGVPQRPVCILNGDQNGALLARQAERCWPSVQTLTGPKQDLLRETRTPNLGQSKCVVQIHTVLYNAPSSRVSLPASHKGDMRMSPELVPVPGTAATPTSDRKKPSSELRYNQTHDRPLGK